MKLRAKVIVAAELPYGAYQLSLISESMSQPRPMPVPTTDEERTLVKIMETMKKVSFGPGGIIPPYGPGTAPETILILTKQEYVDLAKPGPGDTIELVAEKTDGS